MAFIAATLSYLFAPELANNKLYLLFAVIVLFWIFTILNCFGMKVSSLVSIIGATFGTIVPMLGIIVLGLFWIIQGHPIEISHTSTWLPDLSSLGNVSLFPAVLFGLLGMEMSAVHAEEVKNPQRDYPRALLYSTIVIFSTLVLGSLAIVLVVPENKLSVVSGLIDAYALFFKAYNMPWMTSVTALLIVVGALSSVSAWIIGPTRGLLVAARDGTISKKFTRVNKHGAPVTILITQALIFTLMSSILGMFDSINAAYWMLSDLCAQLALLVYMFMFSAAIKLRYSRPDQRGAYRIPGGRLGVWLVSGVGLICCFMTIMLGFVPPSQIPIEHTVFFEACLITGFLLFVLVPWIFTKKNGIDHDPRKNTI
jgi:amino acid transporter